MKDSEVTLREKKALCEKGEIKSTPLPWVKDYGGTKGHIKAIINDGQRRTPTVVRYDIELLHVTPEEQEANAEFIVRAVNSHDDLLEACQIGYDTLRGEYGGPDELRYALNKLKQALAMAGKE